VTRAASGVPIPRQRVAGESSQANASHERLAHMASRPTTSALATGAFLVGLIANLVLALSVSQFPFEDVTNNLARYVVLDRAWFGGQSGPIPPYIETHFVVGPYLGLDLIGAALVHVGGPHFALHALAALVVCAVPVGFWLLLRAVGRANLAWSLVGVLIGMGFFTVVGFVNYVVGLGMAMAWLAAWWPARESPSYVRTGLLWLGIILLYLLHLSAPLIVLVFLWIDAALALARARTENTGAAREERRGADETMIRRVAHDRRIQFVVGATIVVAVMCLAGGIGSAPPAPRGVALDYPPLSHKLRNIFSAFYVFSLGQMAITMAVYGGMVLAWLVVNRHALAQRARWSVFLVAALACFTLFLVFPAGTPGTGYLDMRWLPPVFLWPFCAAESQGAAPPRAVTVLMLAGCLLHDAVIGRTVRTIERELANYHAVLQALPPGSRVLPIVADGERHGVRIFPYRHFVFWFVIERGGRAPGLFNGNGEGNGRPAHGFLGHFMERDHLYEPADRWGLTDFHPLDWRRIGHDYDYIIEAGANPLATRLLDEGARPVDRVGDVTLFEVRKPMGLGG
jgi:hypothetical protein